MARPNAHRTIRDETNLAERVRYERELRGWSYETLARKMTATGCSINGSAIFKIEKGDPPRRITLNEALALARAFDTDLDDLLTPMEALRQERGKEILARRDEGIKQLGQSMATIMEAFTNHLELAAGDPELFEYVHNLWYGAVAGETSDSPPPLFHLEVDGREVAFDDTVFRKAMMSLYLALLEQAERNVCMIYPHLTKDESK